MPVALELGEGDCDSARKISSWSSTAVIRRAYDILYKEKGYKKSVLLGASINRPWHVDRVITKGDDHPLHTTITWEQLVEFDNDLKELRSCISDKVNGEILKTLLKSETFVKAFEPDALKPEDFDSFKPTLKTLEGFREHYTQFIKWCQE